MQNPIDVMIAGAQKAGTTSLASYLSRSPDIVSHASMEFRYFVDASLDFEDYSGEGERFFSGGNGLRMAKSVGVLFLPFAHKRLHSHNPACRILVSLRDPVERAYSAYWYMRQLGLESCTSFEEALSIEERRLDEDFDTNHHLAYVERGMYAKQLHSLTSYFPESQVLLLASERLRSDPHRQLADVADFLEIPFVPQMLEVEVSLNSTTAARSQRLAKLMSGYTAGPLQRRVRRAVARHSAVSQGIHQVIGRANSRPQFRVPPMATEVRSKLTELYRLPNQQLEREFDFQMPAEWS